MQIVERFNFEINMRVLAPVRCLINAMERRRLLSKEEPRQVYAFSLVVQPLVQYGLDLLHRSWNAHRISARKGCPGTGGVPNKRVCTHPHPGAQAQLPAGVNMAALYEAANQEPLRRVPEYTAAAEPLLAHPQLRAQRAAAVAAIVGTDIGAAWMEIIACNYARFIHAYLTFLG